MCTNTHSFLLSQRLVLVESLAQRRRHDALRTLHVVLGAPHKARDGWRQPEEEPGGDGGHGVHDVGGVACAEVGW